MSKIYVRERVKVGKGAGKPRLAVVATNGVDLKVYHSHLRRLELEKIAEDLGAEIVYLPRGEKSADDEGGKKGGGGRRKVRKFAGGQD